MVVYSKMGSACPVLLSREVEGCEGFEALFQYWVRADLCIVTKILTVGDEAVGENVGQRLVGSTEIEPGG